MYSKFEALDGEKRQRIMNAGMKEFARWGYDRASTNRIVEDAGIAKGLLFHYFTSKKRLFLYLYDQAVRRVTEEVFGGMDFSEGDFFERLRMAQRIKRNLIQASPDIMDFLKAAYLEESEAVRGDVEARNSGLTVMNFQKVFEGVDTSLFRPGLDVSLAVKTIAWAYEGFASAQMEALRRVDALKADYEALFKISEEYTAFLKKCFYRQDENINQ